MSLMDEIYKRIKEEIDKDPQKVGYAGKTDTEIAILLNTNVNKKVLVEEISAAPVARILAGLVEAPNQVTKEEITAAKSVQVDE